MSTRMMTTTVWFSVFGAIALTHLGCGGRETRPDSAVPVDSAVVSPKDAGRDSVALSIDAATPDLAIPGDTRPDTPVAADAPVDAARDQAIADGGVDSTGVEADAHPDALPTYSCGAFPVDSNWKTVAGFRASVVAKGAPLSAPVALTFAAGDFGGYAYIVDQGTNQVLKLDARTGALTPFIAGSAWPKKPQLLTTIVWDAARAFDGQLYIGDQGGDGDADSTIFRGSATGTSLVFAAAPGPGLDDIYGMAFSPGGAYPAGLFVSGDTDGSGVGFGVLGATGAATAFAPFSGVEGLAVDTSGRFGGGLFASMPAGGGYAGDDTVSPILANGTKGAPLASAIPGVHALVFAPAGPFGGDAYVASWSSQKILRIKPDGTSTDLASGLSLTNYDGNILSFSPDGRVLFVADRSNARIICIEPST